MNYTAEQTNATQHDIAHLEALYAGRKHYYGEMLYFAIDADPACKFYRLEVTDDTQKLRIALGNPIWNEG